MSKRVKKSLTFSIILLAAFALWTVMIQCIDVQPVGQMGTDIGFASWNIHFHELTGVHMAIYTLTDWLGLVPILICVCFGLLGLQQWIQRRNMWKVDVDILILGLYYIIVIAGFVLFEMFPVNYRTVLIEGALEASYPSSTTLLVLSVMPTLKYQADRRIKNVFIRNVLTVFTAVFSLFMVLGRLISGVHWVTDIVGGVFFSNGLYLLYYSVVELIQSKD